MTASLGGKRAADEPVAYRLNAPQISMVLAIGSSGAAVDARVVGNLSGHRRSTGCRNAPAATGAPAFVWHAGRF